MNNYCSNCDKEFEEDYYRYCPYCGVRLICKEEEDDMTSIGYKHRVYSNGCGHVIDYETHWVLRFDIDYGRYIKLNSDNSIWLDKIDYSFNDAVDYLNKNWYKIGV